MRVRLIMLLGLAGHGCAGRVFEREDIPDMSATSSGGARDSGHPVFATGGTEAPSNSNSRGGACGTSSVGGNSSAGNATAGSAASGGAGITNPAGGGPACPPGRWVMTEEVMNARDLGGLSLNDGATSACGQLYRGGPLSSLTSLGCRELNELGIRTVIDLRIDGERTSVPDQPCVFTQAKVVYAPLPVPYALSPTQYLAILNTYDSIATAFAVLGDQTSYPIYFHCTYGRDRTGVLAAIILLTLGATRDDVYAEYQLTAQSGLFVPPDSITAVLDDIDQRGGIGAYLSDARISPSNVATLRTSMMAH